MNKVVMDPSTNNISDALKSLYIIKRTPSPEPVAAVPSPVIPRVKRERDNGENIKPEPQAKRSKYKITIDLTADSSDDDSIITLDQDISTMADMLFLRAIPYPFEELFIGNLG